MTNHGIDYGIGRTNIDRENGIRFGVIPMNALNEWAWESMEADYGTPSCPKCGNDAIDVSEDESETDREDYKADHCCGDYACDDCQILFDGDEAFGEEPIGHTISESGYEGFVDSSGDLMITKSPYYTHAQFCSPCAPGACYLLNPTSKSGPKAYCLGHDWFDKDKAPYPVFLVSDGTLVKPGK